MEPWIRAGAGFWVGFGLWVGAAAQAAPSSGVLDPSVPELPNTFSVGGGALGFVSSDREPTLARAASWLVRYGYSPATTVTWEVAYMGAMNLTPAETGADGVFATLVDLDLRVNIVPMTAVYPFIAGGVGYGVFERSRPDGGGGLDYSTLTVPLAAGIEVLLSDVAIESRVQYRPTFFDDELRFTGAGSDSWTWTAAVGARF